MMAAIGVADEGAIAFEVAAKVLPARIQAWRSPAFMVSETMICCVGQAALDNSNLRALQDALSAQERCYRIYPEVHGTA